MEPKYVVSYDGQEVRDTDITGIGDRAALADDRVFAELFRMLPYSASAVKAILPFGVEGNQASKQTVSTSGASDAKVYIRPFRAFVGSRTAEATSPIDNWRDIRSCVFTGATTTLYQAVTLAATVSNHRWDLIYARLDIDVSDAPVTREVKDINDIVTSQSVVVAKKNTVTIGVVTGTEGASPARPALPSDTAGTTYYIPLAYVRLDHPFTAASAVNYRNIFSVAPVLPLSRTTGAVTMRPCNQAYKDGGPMLTSAPWQGSRPASYLPPDMVGGEELIFVGVWGNPAGAYGSPQYSTPLNTAVLIDDSVDWRKRYFETLLVISSVDVPASDAAAVGTNGAPNPTGFASLSAYIADPTHNFLDIQVANSFQLNITAGAVGGSEIASFGRSGAVFHLIVQASTGALFLFVGSTDPNCSLYMRIRASAPFANGS